jgi:CubicO group peptidase (beta-lactamase class C family)
VARVFAAALLVSWPVVARAELPQSLRRYFEAHDRGRQPGAAVLVLEGDRVLHEGGYGLADLDRRQKITSRTSFRLASLSKQFTAAAIARLAETGRLALDDALGKFLPQLPAAMRAITLEQAIHHTSGLPEYLDLIDAKRPPRTNAQVVELLQRHPRLVSHPGRRYAYCNTGYVLLALVVERASGTSYARFLREQFFAPLGMKDTFVDGESPPGPTARGYRRLPALRRYELAREPGGDGAILGDGGIHSSIADFKRWATALQQRNKIAAPSTLRQLFARGHTGDGRPVDYGFGWQLEWHAGHKVALHTGTWQGFRNIIAHVPERGLWVVVLSNGDRRLPNRLFKPWLRDYLRRTKAPRSPRARVR